MFCIGSLAKSISAALAAKGGALVARSAHNTPKQLQQAGLRFVQHNSSRGCAGPAGTALAGYLKAMPKPRSIPTARSPFVSPLMPKGQSSWVRVLQNSSTLYRNQLMEREALWKSTTDFCRLLASTSSRLIMANGRKFGCQLASLSLLSSALSKPAHCEKGASTTGRDHHTKKQRTEILRLLRTYTAQIVLLIFLAFAIVAMNSVVPLVLGKLYDLKNQNSADSGACHTFTIFGLSLLIPVRQLSSAIIVLGATAICRSIVNYCIAVTTNRIELDLRQKIFEAFLLRKDMSFYDQNQVSVLIEQMENDAQLVAQLFSLGLVESIKASGKIVVGLGYVVYVSPEIGVATAIMIPVGVALALTTFHQLIKTQYERQRALAELKGGLNETLTGIRTVRAFSAEDRECRSHSDRIADLSRKCNSAFFSSCAHAGNFHLMNSFAISVWLALGTALAWSEKITQGQVNSIVQYSKAAGEGLAAIADQQHFLKGGMAAARIFDFLDEVPLIESCSGPSGSHSGRGSELSSGAIELKSVRFVYPTRRNVKVLDGASITLERGQTSALVGPSGSGKSTISDLILRFYDPEEGSIAIGGKDIRQVNVHELRSKIAVVQQEPFLFSGTIGDNIRYGNPQADQAALEKAAREAFAHDFISQFPKGYNEQIGSGGRQLSGGQKQRIAIARAILKRPEILIMDEATSALDTESEFHLQKSLAELIKKHNMTVLVIAHRMSTIKDADKIYVLQRGRVREEGSHSELLARNGVYAELFRLSGSHKS